jgi:hypothetical protein
MAGFVDSALLSRTELLQREAARLVRVHCSDNRPVLLANNQVFAEWWTAMSNHSTIVGTIRVTINARRKDYENAEIYKD